MAVKYKLKTYNNPSSDFNQWVFARAYQTSTIDLKGLAEKIERNSTAKKSDVLAVLTELVEVITEELQNSKTVVVDGLGRFKMGVRGHFCPSVEQWSAAEYIYGIKVMFEPEYTLNADYSRNTALISGAKLEQYDEYDAGVNDNQRA